MTEPTPVTRKNLEELKEEIEHFVTEYIPIMGLENWQTSLNFWSDEHGSVASATATPHYGRLHLYVHPEHVCDPEENPSTEELVVHEMTHAISWPVWDELTLMTETVVGLLGLKGAKAEAMRSAYRKRHATLMEDHTTKTTYVILRARGRPLPPALTIWHHKAKQEEDDDSAGE